MAHEPLEAWVGATLQPEPLHPQEVARSESSRLWRLHYVASGASQIPRRLGGEATGAELSRDKRVSRQISHLAKRLGERWSDYPLGDGVDLSQDSAQVVWEDWWPDHREWLVRRIKCVATWGVTHNHKTCANRYVDLLSKELAYLERVFRSK
jgi:hypothetical protein